MEANDSLAVEIQNAFRTENANLAPVAADGIPCPRKLGDVMIKVEQITIADEDPGEITTADEPARHPNGAFIVPVLSRGTTLPTKRSSNCRTHAAAPGLSHHLH